MESLFFCPQNSGSLVCWTLTAIPPSAPWTTCAWPMQTLLAGWLTWATSVAAVAAVVSVVAVAGHFEPVVEEVACEFAQDRPLYLKFTDF
jgi:hypothetical protein